MSDLIVVSSDPEVVNPVEPPVTHEDVIKAMRHRNGGRMPTPAQLEQGFSVLGDMVNEEFIKDVVYGGEKPRGHIRRANGMDLFDKPTNRK